MLIRSHAAAHKARAIALSIFASLALGGCFSGENTDPGDGFTYEAKVKPAWANPGKAGGNKGTTTPTDTTTGDTTTTPTTDTATSGTTTTTPTDTTTPTTDAATSGTTTTTPTDTTTPTTDTATTTQPATVGSAVLFWQPPTTNTDGSSLVDLQGFHIYAGTTATNLSRVASTSASQTSYTIGNLAAGTHYFAVSAYTSTGSESDLSNVASKTIAN